MNNKIKGVNLGGWLVLEKWMTPSLFEETKADDEYYLAKDLDETEYQARLLTHRAEFINESDFLRISAAGFNLVRIPIPYFIFGDRDPFIGCIEYLDKAFEWAKAYKLKILIDLHTAPFSQNGLDNGGLSGVIKWATLPEEVEFELTVLERLAERYNSHEALWGIEVINEPMTEGNAWEKLNPLERFEARESDLAKGSKPITMDFLKKFYVDAYHRMRRFLSNDKVIAFHDGFQLHAWKDFFSENEFINVMLDTHQYVMMAELNGTKQNLEGYLQFLEDLGKEIEEVSKYVKVFVGEWSLFNSYTVGTDTKGGINPTQEELESGLKLSDDELERVYQELWKKSVETWNVSEGYMYWTYKLNIDTINEPSWYGWDSWDASRCLEKKWIINI